MTNDEAAVLNQIVIVSVQFVIPATHITVTLGGHKQLAEGAGGGFDSSVGTC